MRTFKLTRFSNLNTINEELEDYFYTKQNTPEEKLMLAILTQALYDVLIHPKKIRAEDRRTAKKWLLSNDKSSAFSFLSICSYFDLNPYKIRNLVLQVLRNKKCFNLRKNQIIIVR